MVPQEDPVAEVSPDQDGRRVCLEGKAAGEEGRRNVNVVVVVVVVVGNVVVVIVLVVAVVAILI